MATPPLLVFDTAGTLVTSWGGAGAGYEWPHREHGIHVDAGGSVSFWRLSPVFGCISGRILNGSRHALKVPQV